MLSSKALVLLLAGMLCLTFETIAQETSADERADGEDEDAIEQPLGVLRRSILVVDDAQRIASERFGNFMGQVDGFFSNAGTDDDAVSNKSWARIRIDGVRANAEDFELDPSLKVRAVLPRTERKLKLLISTEDEESDTPRQVSDNDNRENQNASLALRFVRGARDMTDVNLDVGIRQRSGSVQTFGRLNTKFRSTLANDWAFNAANSYYHYSKSGFEDKLSFDFRKPLQNKDNLFFRTYTEFNWRKNQKGSIIAHTTGLYWQFDSSGALAFEALAGYHTSLNTGIFDRFRGYELRIRWRHNIWRPWFFYEVWPSVSWPSINGYNRTGGILLRAEIMIGQF